MAFWLFKTEPDEYSMSDLMAEPNGVARWDGIRNYQARNFLRDDVAVGDEVFIYHSSCKHVGIAGVAKVVASAYADPAQFDAASDLYDAKSSHDKPRWFCVDVKGVQQFPDIIPLKAIKSHPALQSMTLVTQGRLSIQPVREAEWQSLHAAFIHNHS